MLYEVISSPLSLLEQTPTIGDHVPRNFTVDINGRDVTDETGIILSNDPVEYISANRWKLNDSGTPRFFPPEFLGDNIGDSQPVKYIKAGRPPQGSRYRSEENFSRIRFFKGPDSGSSGGRKPVNMEVENFIVRRPDNESPKLDWRINRTLF